MDIELVKRKRADAERAIENILHELEKATGCRVYDVEVISTEITQDGRFYSVSVPLVVPSG